MTTPINLPRVRQPLLAYLGYQAFFLALFAQFPLKNALPGNCDAMGIVAISNIYIAKLGEILGFGAAGKIMFPATNVLAYGESSPGTAAIFIFFKMLGFDDIQALYLFISCIFSLSAVGAFVFAGVFLRSVVARFFVGFAFTCSNMMLARIDEPIALFYFFPLLSFTFLWRFFRTSELRFAYIAAVLGGLQAYCSVYVFIYQTILIVFFLIVERVVNAQRTRWRALVKPAIVYVITAAPVFLFYALSLSNLDIATPFSPFLVTRVMSWQVYDVLLASPNNFLYGSFNSVTPGWQNVRHFNFIGILTVTSAAGAFFLRGKHRVVFAGVALIGLLLAMGPVLGFTAPKSPHFFSPKELFPTPLYVFYEWIPIFRFHRVPIRAYFLVLLAASMLSGVMLQWLLERLRVRWKKVLVVTLFVVLQLVENVPMPMPAFSELGKLLRMSEEHRQFMGSIKDDALVLDLPSRLGFEYPNWDYNKFEYTLASDLKGVGSRVDARESMSTVNSEKDLFLYTRDGLYVIWQTQHRKNIINGIHGYFPSTRLIFDRWINDIPDERALTWLRDQGVDYIVFHPKLLFPGEENLLNGLHNSPLLTRVFGGEDMVAFKFQ